MENDFFKINKECIQHLVDISSGLSLIETKGDSTMVMFKIRNIMDAVLQQIQKDNNTTTQLNVSEEKKEVK